MDYEHYWEDAGMVAVGVTLAASGAGVAVAGRIWGLALLFAGAFFGAYGLFTGIQVAVRGGQPPDPDGTGNGPAEATRSAD